MMRSQLNRMIALLAVVAAIGCANRENEVPNLPPQPAPVTTEETGTIATPHVETASRPTQEVPRIGPEEAKAVLDRGEAILVDVRTAEAYTFEHAAGSVSIPEDQIPARASLLPPDKMIITYCT